MTINDESLNMDENSILVIRGAGPIGWPGSAEVVNMQPSDKLIKQGITELPCIGDGRQSGTSGSPSILNASPESAVGSSKSAIFPVRLGPLHCDQLIWASATDVEIMSAASEKIQARLYENDRI